MTVWRERTLLGITVSICRVLFSMNQICLLAGMFAQHFFCKFQQSDILAAVFYSAQ